jgi:pimeloyl-ACP methyl ester carboxylesterase
MSTVELAFTESGEGRPVVLLHAFPLHSGLFSAILPLPGYRVVTPDLRGFGSSPLGADDPSMAAMARDVVALLDRLDLSAPIVGGVSMGGYVTMEIMRQAPDRLAGVLLVDTKAGADTEAARRGRWAMADAVLADGRRALDPMMQVLLGGTSASTRPDVVATVAGWLDDADPAAVAWAQRAMATRPDSHSTLASADVPGAVVVGTEDVLSPLADAESMATALSASVQVVPDAGHLAVVENPTAARHAVLAALDSLLR